MCTCAVCVKPKALYPWPSHNLRCFTLYDVMYNYCGSLFEQLLCLLLYPGQHSWTLIA